MNSDAEIEAKTSASFFRSILAFILMLDLIRVRPRKLRLVLDRSRLSVFLKESQAAPESRAIP